MSNELTQRQAFLVLNGLPEAGPITLNRILAQFGGDPRAVLRADPGILRAAAGGRVRAGDSLARWRENFDPVREEERLRQSGASFVLPGEEGYPALLREINDPPIGLYRKGPYMFGGRCVAIVGSRKTTLYGTNTARRLAGELASRGFCVVSGMARGIDTAAHEGALAAGGPTAAILGTGLDVIYPPENLDLYRRIAEAGAVVSEFPFGRAPTRQSFPMRNRLVSGISDAVVVVETDEQGGAMITARFAGEQGRLLLAVPGRIDQATSAGCNQLIRDGATLVTSVGDILEEMNFPRPLPVPASTSAASDAANLAPDEGRALAAFEGGELATLDQVAQRSDMTAAKTGVALTLLEMKGLVSKRSDGRYERGP